VTGGLREVLRVLGCRNTNARLSLKAQKDGQLRLEYA
jgi:hypothetical protein